MWDLATGQCRATLKGHTGEVYAVAVTPDGKTVVSGSEDKTIRLWDLSKLVPDVAAPADRCYTNAKVLLAGRTGVGKTGLALRLCEDRWEPTESTHGMIVSKLELPPVTIGPRRVGNGLRAVPNERGDVQGDFRNGTEAVPYTGAEIEVSRASNCSSWTLRAENVSSRCPICASGRGGYGG